MRRVPRLLGLCLLFAGDPAAADDLRTVFFAGFDSGHSAHGHAGFKHALNGPLDASGFVATAVAGAGGSRADKGRQAGIATLVGHQWALPGWHVTLLAGPEIERDGGVWAGARLQAEVWARPLEDTLLTLTVIAGSARPHAWARVAAGYRLWADVHAGPELSASHEPGWRETRAGLHLTGVRVGSLTLRLSAGAHFTEANTGFYTTISTHVTVGRPN